MLLYSFCFRLWRLPPKVNFNRNFVFYSSESLWDILWSLILTNSSARGINSPDPQQDAGIHEDLCLFVA